MILFSKKHAASMLDIKIITGQAYVLMKRKNHNNTVTLHYFGLNFFEEIQCVSNL